MIDFSKTFVYGSQYWRPPTPPRDMHRRHLMRIKNDMGFDLIKYRMSWSWMHRQRDRFVFDEVHELFDLCDELEINVLLELCLESAPYWLEHEHPEARYVNANGRAIELGAQEATPGGGHPGLCMHHEVVLEQAERFTRTMVREFKDRKSLAIYDCWNEPHLEPVWCNNMWGNLGDKIYCYCQGSRAAFRGWLAKRYGDIEVFNAAWARSYSSFEHIHPPILTGNYADWLDWLRFWYDELADHMRWRVQIIKQEDPTRMVISHSGAVPPVVPRANACIHNWKFAAEVDMWGTSFAPQGFSWDLATCAQVIELTRGAARGKPFIVSEMPGGASNLRGFVGSRIPKPQDYHLWNWMAAALGSRGTLHWCYAPERTGHEAGGYGMVRANGDHTPRSRGIAKTAALLKKHQDILMAAKVPTQVAVVYEPDNSSLLLAMELEDKRYGKVHCGYYRSIWKSDLTARYVTHDTLEDVREKVLIVPMALTMPDSVAKQLARFVHEGGILITEARTGMYDEHGFVRPELPAGRLREAAGLVEGEQVYSDPDNAPVVPTADGTIDTDPHTRVKPLDPIHMGVPISFSEPLSATVPAHGFLVPLQLEGARPIATYGDMVLGACHDYGKGRFYYFGTYLGLALDKNITDAHALLCAILQEHTAPVISGDRLRPRLVSGEGAALLVVFNDHLTETVSEDLALPAGFGGAEDIVTGKKVAIEEGKVFLTVAAEDAVILRLEKG